MRISVIAKLITSTAFLTAGAAMAATQLLPHQKLGLWQQVYTVGGKNISDQVCLDATAEAKLSALGSQLSNKACSSRQTTRNPNGSWHIDAKCEVTPGLKTTSHIDVTGDFNTKFTAVINTTTTGAAIAAANGARRTVLVATWLGPCKPGQKGGDIIMSNGMKINLMDDAKAPH
ncbi:MAG: hypothetical protein KGM97_06535 [Alphaproteobacteria bacterium]|nr:hypothetical protein [Alphaproteobacteria bacterium]MDE2630630.1 hypothetical protein [Alphaproteobacteria bacterium]